MSRRSPRRAVAACALAALVVAGCRGDHGGAVAPQDAAGTPHRGGQLVVGLSSDISGVNQLIQPTSQITEEVLRRLFLSLVDEMPDLETIRPSLASAWEFSDDHKTLTFTLRDDVTWSDGVPVTADDVVFTWRAWTDPDVAWDGADSVEAVEAVEAVDPHTVRFRFSQVYSTQLVDVASNAVVLPAHAWGKLPFSEWRRSADWFREHLVVDGPFRLASWTPQQEIVLERNPTYYEPGLPRLDRVVLRVVPEQSSQVTQLLGGQLDFVIQLSPDDVPRVRRADDAAVVSYWSNSFVVAAWNHRHQPFDDPAVRRALTLGIDRVTLAASIWGDLARPIASPLLPGTWANDPAIAPLPYDPDASRRLLAERGWEDHDGDGVRDRDGRPLRFRLVTNAGNRQREDALVLIQEQLRRVGVAVEPASLEFNTFIEQLVGGDYDAAVFAWTVPTTLDLRFAFDSAEIGNSNVAAWSNPEVDRLLADIRTRPSLKDARGDFVRLQEILRDQQPYTFLWQSKRLNGIRRRVHGAEPNQLFALSDLRTWWVGPESG